MNSARQHNRSRGALRLMWAALLMLGMQALSPAALQAASLAKPESVRDGPPVPPNSTEVNVAAPLSEAPTSPIPNMNLEAPADRTKTLPVGPVWLKPETAYRGETFSNDSPNNPGREDRHLPLPGIAVTVPLY